MDFIGVIFILFIVCAWVNGVLDRSAKEKRIADAENFAPKNAYGHVHWAEERELRKARLFNRKGLHFGFSPKGRPLYYQKAGHMLLVAAARTGKLLTVIVGFIMSLDKRYSLLLVDPKGEITSVCLHVRKKAGKVFAWNPYGICLDYMKGIVQACCNPMMDIDPDAVTAYSDCHKLTSTYWTEPATNVDPHWSPSALALVASVTYTLVKYGKAEEKNLPTVRAVLTGSSGHSIFEFAREAMKIDDPIVRQGFARYAAPDAEESKELPSIVSTAITQTAFLSNKAIADSLMRPDFSFRTMKRTPETVSLILPAHRLEDGKCFALLSGWMLHCALDEAAKGRRTPCVAVLDEMSEIGYSKAWLDAFSLGAGAAGLQILAVYQDVSQIVNQFGEKVWRTVVQNCGLTIWFGARDHQTQQTVSELAGTTEIITQSRSVTIDRATGEPNVSNSKAQMSRPFIHPVDVGKLPDDEMIVFCEGVKEPIKAKRKPYFKVFSGYRPNPFYRKPGFWK